MGEPVEVIRAAALNGLPHGFLGRRGGVSTGIHAGLNVGWGSDDDRAAIAENRRRAVEAVLPGATLVTVHQVHSPDVVTVTEPWSDPSSLPLAGGVGGGPVSAGDALGETRPPQTPPASGRGFQRPKADALVTDRPGLLLGVLTADCAPVLLADREAGVIGAAHAGWKGALAGVTDATVAAMEALGARRGRIAAAIGPCIAQVSYEVDDAFRARFGPDHARFFRAGREGHAQFDLEGYVASRLQAAGVGTVEKLGLDTYADEFRFFSYRRATHRGEPGYGREISVISL